MSQKKSNSVTSVENIGARMVREAASKTSDDAGDGTTTATIMAEAILKDGLATTSLQALMRTPSFVAFAAESRRSSPTSKIEPCPVSKIEGGIAAVATISANNDVSVGRIMADAFKKVGKDGVITVEEGKGRETER